MRLTKCNCSTNHILLVCQFEDVLEDLEEETEDGEQEGDQESVEKDLERLQLVDESNKPDGVISEETVEDKAPEDGRIITS